MKQRSEPADATASNARVIEVRVGELKRLFNAMDPTPFDTRDLDPRAEEFIVTWARELPREAPLALRIHLDRATGAPDELASLRNAMQQFFTDRAAVARRRLRSLFHRGRMSLAIGLAFLAGAVLASELIGSLQPTGLLRVLRESLVIGGWVAMWRPIEVFLYDWWPIRAEARLFDRLAAMPVSVEYANGASETSPKDRAANISPN